MNQIAKKGDMAVIVPALPYPPHKAKYVGSVCTVVSDPYQLPKFPEFRQNDCILFDGTASPVATSGLVPIRDPDADVTRTTDREVAA